MTSPSTHVVVGSPLFGVHVIYVKRILIPVLRREGFVNFANNCRYDVVDAHVVWLMNNLAEQLVAAGLKVGRCRADVVAKALGVHM